MGKITPITKYPIQCCGPGPTNGKIDFPNCTFLGGLSDQPFTAFFIWEQFFGQFKDTIKRFIEFGCDQGNTSVYFLLWCINIGATYIGYDKRAKGLYKNTKVKTLIGLHKHMRIGNGYKKGDEIKRMIRLPGQSVIFTDCIDKPWEFRTFAPMLKKGDVLAIHDWDRAIFDNWVEDTLNEIKPYSLLYEKERLQLKTLTRFFLKH
jgi:hypothetical protein